MSDASTPEHWLGIKPDPPVWDEIERYAQNNDEFSAALLSLRARVEALEANAKSTPNFSQIRSSAEGGSLVERVSAAVDGRINPDQWLHMEAARAAIREVAAWLKEQERRGLVDLPEALEQEAAK